MPRSLLGPWLTGGLTISTGAVAASKGYVDAITRLARHAHQATWGGCTDIGECKTLKLLPLTKARGSTLNTGALQDGASFFACL